MAPHAGQSRSSMIVLFGIATSCALQVATRLMTIRLFFLTDLPNIYKLIAVIIHVLIEVVIKITFEWPPCSSLKTISNKVQMVFRLVVYKHSYQNSLLTVLYFAFKCYYSLFHISWQHCEFCCPLIRVSATFTIAHSYSRQQVFSISKSKLTTLTRWCMIFHLSNSSSNGRLCTAIPLTYYRVFKH